MSDTSSSDSDEDYSIRASSSVIHRNPLRRQKTEFRRFKQQSIDAPQTRRAVNYYRGYRSKSPPDSLYRNSSYMLQQTPTATVPSHNTAYVQPSRRVQS